MTKPTPLEGRVAIVTGGARGIGAAISKNLMARGARVIIADNGVDTAGNNADPLIAEKFARKAGEGAVAYTEDISVPATAKHVIEMARDTFGGIDIVINNAAILRDAFIFKGNTDDWDKVIQNNLSAAFYLMAAATSVMRDQARSGRGGGGGIQLGSACSYYFNRGFYRKLRSSPLFCLERWINIFNADRCLRYGTVRRNIERRSSLCSNTGNRDDSACQR